MSAEKASLLEQIAAFTKTILPERQGEKPVVLVVDDSVEPREMIRLMVQRASRGPDGKPLIEVQTTETPEEAFGIIRKFGQRMMLVLVDLHLQGDKYGPENDMREGYCLIDELSVQVSDAVSFVVMSSQGMDASRALPLGRSGAFRVDGARVAPDDDLLARLGELHVDKTNMFFDPSGRSVNPQDTIARVAAIAIREALIGYRHGGVRR